MDGFKLDMWNFLPAILSSVLGVVVKQVREVKADHAKKAAIKRRLLVPRVTQWVDPAVRAETAKDIISAVYGFTTASTLEALTYWIMSWTVLKGKINIVDDFLKDHIDRSRDPEDWRAIGRLLDDILAVL